MDIYAEKIRKALTGAVDARKLAEAWAALHPSDFAAKDTRRCETAAVPWLTWRDPSGAIRARLESVGALADGCVDTVGMAEAMAAEFAAHGLRTSLVHLTDGGSTDSVLAPADLSRMVDAVVALIR